MAKKSTYRPFETHGSTGNLADEFTALTSILTEYIIDNEPEDLVNPDNIIMKKATIGNVTMKREEIISEVSIEVPYATRRNYQNYKNPQHMGYIEKGVDEGLDLAEGVDYAEAFR